MNREPEPFSHVNPDVRHLVLSDLATRRSCIFQDIWIPYPAGDAAVRRLVEIYDMPRRRRMPSVLFYADPNMGKTTIIDRFSAVISSRDGADEAGEPRHILKLEANAELSEKRLYIDLLSAMKTHVPDASAARLQAKVLLHIAARQDKTLILDEMQNITELAPRSQRPVVNALRYISNQLSVSLACFGSYEAKALIEADPHLKQRFEIIPLPAWKAKEKWAVDTVRERIAYMPLRHATTVDRTFMNALIGHSDNLVGRMFDLLERAAAAALEHEEQVTPELIEMVALRGRRPGAAGL